MHVGTLTLAGLLLALGLAGAAPAQTLRWASRGDVQTLDPHGLLGTATTNFNALIYEALVTHDRDQQMGPNLATDWTLVDPKTWRFNLRRNVRFHDGTPFSADDVVFSIERAQQRTSQFAVFAKPLGQPVRIDDHTLELRLAKPNPLLLDHLSTVLIMSRRWAAQHKSERVPDFRAKEEGYSTSHAMGTGPYRLTRREPGVRTEARRNPDWWGRFDGNVQELVFLPIANDATRVAALLSGDADFTQEAPTQDLERLAREPALRVLSGPENRLIFLGMDQSRDELLYSSVKGRNPFKDVRVREAFARAIDADALKTSIMRGRSEPTGCLSMNPQSCWADELRPRPPADLARARKLMADAGYADGFEVRLDCPNDRYINDQALCVAIVGMLARINVSAKLDARPQSLHFPKIQSRDTSLYLNGWGASITDPQLVLDPLVRSPDPASGKGGDNNGRIADPELDAMIDAAGVETDADKRRTQIVAIQRRIAERYHYLPLHHQALAWLARSNLQVPVTPGNRVRVEWAKMD